MNFASSAVVNDAK